MGDPTRTIGPGQIRELLVGLATRLGRVEKQLPGPNPTFKFGVKSPGVRTTTVTNSPQAVSVDANGVFGIAASTQAMKNILGPYAVDMTKFLNINLKSWAYKESGSTGMGPIADELDAAGLREFVIYNLDGTVQGIKNEFLLIGLWSAYTQSRTATLGRIAKQSHQVVTVTGMSALSLGGTAQYAITWPTSFADSDYLATASVVNASGAVVAGATASVIQSSKTTTGCTIAVAAGIALLANQTLVIEGLHV